MGCGSSVDTHPNNNNSKTSYPTQQATFQKHSVQQGSSSANSHANDANIENRISSNHNDLGQDSATVATDNEPAAHVELDKHILLKYVEIEKRINVLEAKNVVQLLQIRWDELKGLEDEIKKLTAIFNSCRDQTVKEKLDVDEMQEPSVKEFFKDKTAFDKKFSKEQEEFLDALNKQEFAQKKLQNAIKTKEETKIAVKELHGDAEELQKLYKTQDELLATIFDGKYGSEKEYRCEREHDIVCERQQRISAAKARWQAAKLLVDHANKQLGYASQRWNYIAQIPTDLSLENLHSTAMKLTGNLGKDFDIVRSLTLRRNGQMRYHIATEVRNYLIAASTNLRNSHKFLKGIEFAYCKPDEINTLERATNNIFVDINTPERHQHAANVYLSLYQRSAALLQWFDAVIDKTIENDLLSATEELWLKKKELRMERVRLIKEKLIHLIGQKGADEAGLDDDANLTDARRLQEQLASVNKEELRKQIENVTIVQPERVEEAHTSDSGADSNVENQEMDSLPPLPPEDDKKPEPIPLKDLAPPPSQNQLFGDIDSLKKQYEIDMEEFSRAQEVNKARVEQGLQEKLAARKSRKARKMAQQNETDKLLSDSAVL